MALPLFCKRSRPLTAQQDSTFCRSWLSASHSLLSQHAALVFKLFCVCYETCIKKNEWYQVIITAIVIALRSTSTNQGKLFPLETEHEVRDTKIAYIMLPQGCLSNHFISKKRKPCLLVTAKDRVLISAVAVNSFPVEMHLP